MDTIDKKRTYKVKQKNEIKLSGYLKKNKTVYGKANYTYRDGCK